MIIDESFLSIFQKKKRFDSGIRECVRSYFLLNGMPVTTAAIRKLLSIFPNVRNAVLNHYGTSEIVGRQVNLFSIVVRQWMKSKKQ